MGYKIIKNAGPVLPIFRGPPKKNAFAPKYPFLLLEEGDAFDVEGEGELNNKNTYNNWQSVSAMATRYGRTSGRKFSCRRVSSKVLRVWRIL